MVLLKSREALAPGPAKQRLGSSFCKTCPVGFTCCCPQRGCLDVPWCQEGTAWLGALVWTGARGSPGEEGASSEAGSRAGQGDSCPAATVGHQMAARG